MIKTKMTKSQTEGKKDWNLLTYEERRKFAIENNIKPSGGNWQTRTKRYWENKLNDWDKERDLLLKIKPKL